jgi:putative ABC transport system permease protein
MLFENLRIALAAIWTNAMRSALTTLGIVIGVAAVIAVVSIVQGFQVMVSSELDDLGTTYIQVVPRQSFSIPGLAQRPVRLTWEDGQEIQRLVRGVERITPLIFANEEVKFRDRQHRTIVLGVDAEWPAVNNSGVDRGRFFTHLDLDRRSKVVVVGADILEELRMPEPIGQEIYVGTTAMTVIGIMESRGERLGRDFDDAVLIPFNSALTIFGREVGDRVQLQLVAKDQEMVGPVREGIERVLRQRHHIAEGAQDDFRVIVQDEMRKVYSRLLGGVTAMVGGIVSIALLVGGIGIMNIMLVSVTERTREIGLRKAVGARRKDILVQFLIEAVALSSLGGLVGIALGYGAGLLISSFLPGDFPPAHVPLWAVGIAFGFCALVGVVFGIYPAGKAASLDPIEALRYE